LNERHIAGVSLWDADTLKTQRNAFCLVFEGRGCGEVFAFGLSLFFSSVQFSHPNPVAIGIIPRATLGSLDFIGSSYRGIAAKDTNGQLPNFWVLP